MPRASFFFFHFSDFVCFCFCYLLGGGIIAALTYHSPVTPTALFCCYPFHLWRTYTRPNTHISYASKYIWVQSFDHYGCFFFSFCCCYKTRYCSLRFCSGSSAKRSWHYGNSACPLQSAAHRCGGPSVRRSSCFFRKVVFSFVLFSVLLPFYESTNWEIQYTCIHMSNV